MIKANWMLRLFLAAVLLTGSFALSGCETWRGTGRDIERAGEGMQGR